jgi:pimeloyl-ACP methyl ester carboxylesterase
MDPRLRDSDGDELDDGAEDFNHNGIRDPGETDPLKTDTDGDGFWDGDEVAGGADPMNYDEVPNPTDGGAPVTYDTTTPVILLHGFAPPSVTKNKLQARWAGHDCSGYWNTMTAGLLGVGVPTDKITTVGYYQNNNPACEVQLGGWGPNGNDPGSHVLYMDSNDHCSLQCPGSHKHTADTNVRHLAYHFAWYLWWKFSKKGQPVTIVAHSMGGLITRYAMRATNEGIKSGAGVALFPPYLLVNNVVTVETPHQGSEWKNGTICGVRIGVLTLKWDQCEDLRHAPLSQVQNFFNDHGKLFPPRGNGGTDWTLVHSQGDCISPVGPSTAFKADHRVLYSGSLSGDDCSAAKNFFGSGDHTKILHMRKNRHDAQKSESLGAWLTKKHYVAPVMAIVAAALSKAY